jgi:hypothetical protein
VSERNIDRLAGLIIGTVLIIIGARLLGLLLGVMDTFKFSSSLLFIFAGNYYYKKWFRGGDE